MLVMLSVFDEDGPLVSSLAREEVDANDTFAVFVGFGGPFVFPRSLSVELRLVNGSVDSFSVGKTLASSAQGQGQSIE